MRPSAFIANAISRLELNSATAIYKKKTANLTSIFEVMALGAIHKSSINIILDGKDELQAYRIMRDTFSIQDWDNYCVAAGTITNNSDQAFKKDFNKYLNKDIAETMSFLVDKALSFLIDPKQNLILYRTSLLSKWYITKSIDNIQYHYVKSTNTWSTSIPDQTIAFDNLLDALRVIDAYILV